MTEKKSRMYKLLGIEAKPIGCTNEDTYNSEYYCNDCEGDCIDCTWYDEDEVYTPFTAEKQLELIKWLAKNLTFGVLVHSYDSKCRLNILKRHLSTSHTDFSQALAGLVCELWKDLTDKQREEIKRILE